MKYLIAAVCASGVIALALAAPNMAQGVDPETVLAVSAPAARVVAR